MNRIIEIGLMQVVGDPKTKPYLQQCPVHRVAIPPDSHGKPKFKGHEMAKDPGATQGAQHWRSWWHSGKSQGNATCLPTNQCLGALLCLEHAHPMCWWAGGCTTFPWLLLLASPGSRAQMGSWEACLMVVCGGSWSKESRAAAEARRILVTHPPANWHLCTWDECALGREAHPGTGGQASE